MRRGRTWAGGSRPRPFSLFRPVVVKLRTAVVLAHAGVVDWILCQVTSNPYGDPAAVPLRDSSFATGGLGRKSFARPGKLFTASEAIMVRKSGVLTPAAQQELLGRVVTVLKSGTR